MKSLNHSWNDFNYVATEALKKKVKYKAGHERSSSKIKPINVPGVLAIGITRAWEFRLPPKTLQRIPPLIGKIPASMEQV